MKKPVKRRTLLTGLLLMIIMLLCSVCVHADEEAAVELRIANKTGDEMAPEQIHIYLEQAYVEGKLHHLETAQEALDNARDLMTDDVTFEYDLILGKLFLENGKHAQAVERFKLAVDHSSHKANTLLSIAISYSEVQMYHDALDILQGMEKLFGESEYPQIYPYIAFCYYKGGDKKNYLKYLKESVHLNSEVTEYLFSKEFPGVRTEEYYKSRPCIGACRAAAEIAEKYLL